MGKVLFILPQYLFKYFYRSLANIELFNDMLTSSFKSLEEKEFGVSQRLLMCPYCHKELS